MKKINTSFKTACESVSSNCVIYQGSTIPCISYCSTATVSDVMSSMGNIMCYSYNQLNTVSEVNLSCYNSEISCDSKNLLSVLNLAFSKLCAQKTLIESLQTQINTLTTTVANLQTKVNSLG